MNSKYKVTVEKTSIRGYSILRITKDSDLEWHPMVSQQMPTEAAEWIESLAAVEDEFVKHLRKFA